MMRLHASCVEIGGHGVLLRGPSGAGKSDLALRLIGGNARLVSDDYTDIRATAGGLVASAPAAIRGLIEVRGLGVLRLGEAEQTGEAPVTVLIDLVAGPVVPRMPDFWQETILDVLVPRFQLAPFEASAIDKVRLAVRLLSGDVHSVP